MNDIAFFFEIREIFGKVSLVKGGGEGCFWRWLCAESAERRAPVHARDIDSLLGESNIVLFLLLFMFRNCVGVPRAVGKK